MTWVHCSKCGNPIMHMSINWPDDPIEIFNLERSLAHTQKTIICKCCSHPSERNCLNGCKNYTDCKITDKKKKYKIRYVKYGIK